MNKNTVNAIQRHLDKGERSFKVGDYWHYLSDEVPQLGYRVLFRSSRYMTIQYPVVNGKLDLTK